MEGKAENEIDFLLKTIPPVAGESHDILKVSALELIFWNEVSEETTLEEARATTKPTLNFHWPEREDMV